MGANLVENPVMNRCLEQKAERHQARDGAEWLEHHVLELDTRARS